MASWFCSFLEDRYHILEHFLVENIDIVYRKTNKRICIRVVLGRPLQESRLWLQPEIRVVLVSGGGRMKAFLHHDALRNSKHVLLLLMPRVALTRCPG